MFSRLRNNEENELPVRCMYCSKEDRLWSFNQVEKGAHIKLAGETGMFNFGRKQVKFYSHHAIIKELRPLNEDGSAAIVTLIQFMSTPFDSSLKIRETVEVKDLNYDEIYVIRYTHKTHSAEEIIRRGERLTNETIQYSGLFCNCEHLAHWCAIGNETSLQSQGFFERIQDYLKTALSFVTKVIGLSLDDMFIIGDAPVVGDILLVVILLYVLLSTIKEHRLFTKLQKEGSACRTCSRQRKRDLWVKFGILLTIQTGGLFLSKLIPLPGIHALVSVLISILTVLLMKYVPKFLHKFSSPFVGRKIEIDSFHKIWVGDVISWKYKGFYHDGIVSGLRVSPGRDKKKAQLTVIHYALPSIFSWRKVLEETVELDLRSDKLRLHDYTGYEFNEPEIVVDRARKRVGETKFGLTNRSSHFCHWAKLKDANDDFTSQREETNGILTYARPMDAESEDYKLKPLYIDHRRKRAFASKEISRECVKIRDDIKPGQLVQFSYRYLPHQAVCTDVRAGTKPSQVIVFVVHYGKSKIVTEEAFTFDLNKDDVMIVKVHPVYKFGKNDIIRRARAKIGERKYSILYNRSSHLAEDIVYKEKDRRIYSFSEVQPGDCVTYYYWWLPHDAVVVNVKAKPTKANDDGYITLVHYALDSLVGTRYIKKERVHFNLSRHMVKLKAFPGSVVYPLPLVVQRALSRVGEKKFHISGNISSDLVHWAKVVQVPCIVTVKPFESNQPPQADAYGQDASEYLLLPKVGKPFDKYFQEDWVKTWDELTPGMIVECKHVRGILSVVNKKDQMITVIQNKLKVFERDVRADIGKVQEVVMKINLKLDYLYVYRGEPNFCNQPSVSLMKAQRMVAKTVAGMSEWGFCRVCVVRNNI